MQSRIALISCSIGLAVVAAAHGVDRIGAASGTPQSAVKATKSTAVPVLVELFTAEGCSSCPPADVLLEKILEAQPTPQALLVGLGEHVDYWDQLGWKDRFSSNLFTKRQQQYAARRREGNDVYTPQMVVDGGEGFVGSDLAAARRAIEHAAAVPHGVIHLTLDTPDKDTIAVVADVSNLPPLGNDDPAELFLATTEDHLQTDVKRGENQGRSLTHVAVVHQMVTLGPVSAGGGSQRGSLRLDSGWKRANVKIVAFLQQGRSRHIIGTAVLPLG